jgi:hypothetical protein
MKDSLFKFSSHGLQMAQERLEKRKLFKVTEDNFKDYQYFVVESYLASKDLIRRVEKVVLS